MAIKIPEGEKFQVRRSYRFNGQLTEKSIMLETFWSEPIQQYVGVLSNLPVYSFRNGCWSQDIVTAEKDFDKAMTAHDTIIKEGK